MSVKYYLLVAEMGRFAFLSPIWRLRFNVQWSSKAHWKARSGLPISVNWTYFARCYGWGATSECQFKIGTRFTDGWTDGETELSSLDRVCISCSAVKMLRICVRSPHTTIVVFFSTTHFGSTYVETYTCFEQKLFSDFSAKFLEMGATPRIGKIFGPTPSVCV